MPDRSPGVHRRRRRAVWLTMTLVLLVSARASIADTQAPVAISDRATAVHGVELHYLEAGTGPVVVLLHGLAGSAEEWRSTMQALAPRYRVIALDQVGFGRSGKPLLAYRPETFVDFLGGFLDSLAIDRVSLVGSSLGGWVAARFALARPATVDRLVLVGAAGFSSFAEDVGRETVDALRLASRADLKRIGQLAFHDPAYSSQAAVDQAFPGRIAAGDGYTVDRVVDSLARGLDALDGELDRIGQPTLVVHGVSDRLVPSSFATRFAQGIRGARLVSIEACGHLPQVECPGPLTTQLQEFLAGAGP
jgi:pimeloyl-ACP methyl ester carboxylesterase